MAASGHLLILRCFISIGRDMVEREYTSHLRASNDADGMVQAGVVDGALDLYAQRGDWDKVRLGRWLCYCVLAC